MAIDYSLLLSKQVNLNLDTDVDAQVLQIAIYDEFKAYETYSKVIEKFGNIDPFVKIKEAEAVHYSVLIDLAQKYSIEVPVNDWQDRIEVPNSYIECCELGVAAEIENVAMYNKLLAYTSKSDIVDVFFRLQAASFNNHLPTFRNCVNNHYNSGNLLQNSDEVMQKMQEYQTIIEDVLNGNIDESMISKLFSNVSFQFLGGVAGGVAFVTILKQFLENQNLNKE